MTSLQKVFLANVALFLKDKSTVQTFSLINKKCLDALHILHVNPYCNSKTLVRNRDTSVVEETSIFPNLETICFDTKESFKEKCFSLPSQIKRIILHQTPQDINDYPSSIKNMIVEMNVTFIIDIQQFKSLEKLTLDLTTSFGTPLAITDCFINKKSLETLKIKFCNTIDVNFFKSVDDFNIHHIFAFCDVTFGHSKLQEILSIPKINRYVHFTTNQWYNEIDHNVMVLSDTFNIYNNIFDKELLRNYNISNVCIRGEKYIPSVIDLHDLPHIQSLKIQQDCVVIPPPHLTSLMFVKNYKRIQTNNLKELHVSLFDGDIVVPSGVTSLTLSNCNGNVIFEGNNLKELHICQQHMITIPTTNQLTSISLYRARISTSLNTLKHLQFLSIHDTKSTININDLYPTSLKTLDCDDTFVPLTSNITNLEVTYNSSHSLNLTRLSNLKELILHSFSTKVLKTIQLPIHIEFLSLNNIYGNDLCCFEMHSNITQVKLMNCIGITITLPSFTKELFINQSRGITISNIKDINVESLHTDSSNINCDEFSHSLKSLITSVSAHLSKEMFIHFPLLLKISN
ncbi:Leucine-rich repeat containing protein [Entamoeba marina]